MRRRVRGVAGLALAALLVGTTTAGCGADRHRSARRPAAAPSTPATAATASSGTASSGTAPSATAERPAPVTSRTHLLHWSAVEGDTDGTLLSNGHWTLSVPQDGSSFGLDGGAHGFGASAPPGFKVNDVLLDEQWAVVVLQDKRESRPERATVYDLDHHGRTWRINGGSDVPTTTGGSWTLAGDTLVHATVAKHSYCAARVDLATRSSVIGYCAPPRHGWNSPLLGPGGESMLTFDDGHPSCRTVVSVDGSRATPFAGVPKCKGAQGALLADGEVWSVVPNEHRFEQVLVRAHDDAGYRDLGPAVNGSLTVCGDAAFWARDPSTDNAPAELMRWDGHSLDVVYRSGRGHAFLGAPSCAGSRINVSSYSDQGDEAVSAPLG